MREAAGGRGGEDAAGPRCHSPTQEPPVRPARGAALAMKTGKRSRRDAPGDSCTAWPGEADLTGHSSRDAHLGREDARPRGRAVRPPGGLRPGGVRGGLSPDASGLLQGPGEEDGADRPSAPRSLGASARLQD